MKKCFFLILFLISSIVVAQTNYSSSWEDFYSYNNVKDFVKVNNNIYALTDNAAFTYDLNSNEIQKISSVQGLSGETTSSIHYNKTFKRIVIGYENGLVEVIDEDNTITTSSDIVNFNQLGEKTINHISEFRNKLYLSTPFAIVVYDIEKLEFGDTYFIGNDSSDIRVHQTAILDEFIYAATEDGIFKADLNSSLLIDYSNWRQSFIGRNFTQITAFNNELIVVENTTLNKISGTTLTQIKNFSKTIIAVKESSSQITVALNTSAFVLDASFNQIFQSSANADFNFTLNSAFFDGNTFFLATKEFGVLSTTQNLATQFTEIHPEGPLSNDVFSIAASNENLWVVYGGYDVTYTSLFKKQGFSHFNGKNWINTRFDSNSPFIDLNYISIDPNAENRVYISSYGDTGSINSVSTGGLLVVENDEVSVFYNHLNSGLEDLLPTIPNRVTIRIGGTAFDSQGNLWIANSHKERELKKLSPSGVWSSFDLSAFKVNSSSGLNEIAIDRSNTVWMGTRRNGVYAFNENGNKKRALNTNPNLGNLPDTDVLTVAIDRNDKVWLGTRVGMVVFSNAATVFEAKVLKANPVVIEENGVGERLLGDQRINSIVVDGADNKWFGTDNGGVLYTNPNGQTTLANFSKQNSPLPSNRILKIRVDDSTGKVYFATDKGIVAYNSNVAPFGNTLEVVYAYPNPALKNHETVTIDGRNGTHLPKGTNVKILDVAGYLVYETNVVEGQELQGGKVVWDKTNLAGKKVASGVYIVLLSNKDTSKTSTTKIAIVN